MAPRSQVVSISIEGDVLSRFDGWLAAKGFPSRSSAIQHVMAEKLDELAVLDGHGPAIATVTYVYDHHRRELMERLAQLQHEHLAEVVTSTHVHLDEARCLEVLILRGSAGVVRRLGEQVVAVKGVERGEVVVTAAGAGRRRGRGEATAKTRRTPGTAKGLRDEHEREQDRGPGRATTARQRKKAPKKLAKGRSRRR